LVKGYQVVKDEYVLLDKEDFESVTLESTRIIDIEKFVPRDGIDRLYWDTPYHLMPSGKTGIEAFAVIREAMKQKRMIAIGRLVMSTRERICAIEIEDDGLLLTTLRTVEGVRDLAELPSPPLPKPDAQMLAIAEKIVDQQAGKFDPSEFVDRYEDALRALIEDKRKGRVIKPGKPVNDDTKVVDLMAALRNSLKGGGASRDRAERFVTSTARRPTAKGKKKPSRRSAARSRPGRKRPGLRAAAHCEDRIRLWYEF
jgi:DNA end-binding protein Ku